MIIASEKMKEVYRHALLCAKTDVEVLLLGESGTGKEVLARTIHTHSRRAKSEFVAINCGSIPVPLLESELFGHERGAFTDAKERRIGKFEEASGGTIFLDEVAELSLEAQAALLRVLETKSFTRLGSNQQIQSNFRLISATNKNLFDLTLQNKFREDLYWRLKVATLTLPPLRERPEDTGPLIDYFLGEIRSTLGKEVRISEAAIKKLRAYHFPGNVRELKNILLGAAVLCEAGLIEADAIVFESHYTNEVHDIIKAIDQFGSIKKAARYLGCSRQTIYNKLKAKDLSS